MLVSLKNCLRGLFVLMAIRGDRYCIEVAIRFVIVVRLLVPRLRKIRSFCGLEFKQLSFSDVIWIWCTIIVLNSVQFGVICI